MKAEKILLGLDIGTNSVGWCVTNEKYQIMKVGGKSLWGSRLFDEAEPQVNRRLFRSARRRYARRKERIVLLQSLFANEMNKLDPMFFERLELSRFVNEDRQSYYKETPTLFISKEYSDKDYYKQYKTIYHLRKDLLEKDQKFDLRLVYLAIHHIIKYRGHFLREGQKFEVSDTTQITFDLKELIEIVNRRFDYSNPVEIDIDRKINSIVNCLVARGYKKDKQDNLKVLFNTSKTYFEKVVIKLLTGSGANFKDILQGEADDDSKQKIDFQDASFEEKLESLSSMADDEIKRIVVLCKNIYDFVYIKQLLGDHGTISNAMVNRYDSHKEQLQKLKKICKKTSKELYDLLFNLNVKEIDKEKINNYVSYVGYSVKNHKREYVEKKCSRKDFYDFLKKKLKAYLPNGEKNSFYLEVAKAIEEQNYLLRQNSSDNGVFPYQLNLMELEKILETQSKYYPFLKDIDSECGLSNIEKIIKILTFKLPYYVGPLGRNSESNPYSWVVRNESGKILPWNFDKKINKAETAEAFIRRMLNNCSYLIGEHCLPKNSITIEFFNVYNEINKILLNGRPLTVEEKKDLIDNLYLKKNVTTKSVGDYYKKMNPGEGLIQVTTSKGKELSDKPSNLTTYKAMISIFGREFVDKKRDVIEDIIKDLAIFNDKDILEERLVDLYGIKEESNRKKLLNMNLSGFSRLSNKLLRGIKVEKIDDSTGELFELSIMDLLEKTNENFMEILYNYRFKEIIDDYNGKKTSDTKQDISEYVDNLYASPGMKRAVVQTYRIIEDIKKIIKRNIDCYYVEVTRSSEEKKKTVSRKDKILKLYGDLKKICKKDTYDFINEKYIEGLEDSLKMRTDLDLRSDKLFLYYTQLGKCLYSGESISISDLYNSDMYDIDHIIPKALVKDDSIENRVLVIQSKNRDKSKTYPIPDGWITMPNYKAFYQTLHDKGFIGDTKLNNLLRRTPLSTNELVGFVNRQLVFTSQSIKAAIQMIKDLEGATDAQVVYSKARNVSDFRNKFNILKCREINDCHHAQDAYLNVVVGRVISSYFHYPFVSKRVEEMKKNNDSMNVDAIFGDHDKQNRIIKDLYGNIVWDSSSISTVKKEIDKKDVLVTKARFVRRNIYSKTRIISSPVTLKKTPGEVLPIQKKNKYIGDKISDYLKYGGYEGPGAGFYCLVKSREKDSWKYTIEPMITSYIKSEDSDDKKIKYLREMLNLIEPEIVTDLKINTVLVYGKSRFCITGKTNDYYVIQKMDQLFYSQDEIIVIKKINKLKNICSMISQNWNLKKVGEKIKKHEDCEVVDRLKFINGGKDILLSPSSKIGNHEIVLSSSEVDRLFESLISKSKLPIYRKYNTIWNLSNSYDKENFHLENLFNKSYVILELIKLLSANKGDGTADLSLLGKAKKFGKQQINKELGEGYKIILESPTGFYSKVLWEYKE